MEDLGPEGLLGTPEGEDAQTLRDRLALALRYIVNWYRATEDSDNAHVWRTKIDQVRIKVQHAFTLADPSQLFLGNTAVAAYTDAALAFPALYRELYLSIDTLPKRSLLDTLAGLADAALQAPGALFTHITNEITKAIGGALGKAIGNLWPYLAIAGGVGLIYVFRGALGKAAERVVPA